MQFLNLGLFFLLLVRLAGCSSASACKQATIYNYMQEKHMMDGGWNQ
jgi:hypothetical protein